jgi:hypothetical protein
LQQIFPTSEIDFQIQLGGSRQEDLSIHDALSRRALDVDDRRLSADGDGFGDRADPQVGIDRRDECSGELDAFALDRGEARSVNVTV